MPIPNPLPPGGNPAGRALELDDRRAADAQRLSGGKLELGPGRTSAVRTATSSSGRPRSA